MVFFTSCCTPWGVPQDVKNTISLAAAKKSVPVLVAYDVPGRDCAQYSAGGAATGDAYRAWIAGFAAGLGDHAAIVILEPDGLALLPADRVIAAEHAWLSPLPPEGASAIAHHDTAHASQMAQQQKVGALDLLDEGIVHVVVPERPAAHEDPEAFARSMAAACAAAIRDATRAHLR